MEIKNKKDRASRIGKGKKNGTCCCCRDQRRASSEGFSKNLEQTGHAEKGGLRCHKKELASTPGPPFSHGKEPSVKIVKRESSCTRAKKGGNGLPALQGQTPQ